MSLAGEKLEQVEVKGLKFVVRKGSSDIKAIKEVVDKRSYERKGFPGFDPAAGAWLDLGANVGAFAVMAGVAGCKVIAVEPDPDSASLLRQNVGLNKLGQLVEVVEAAVVTDPAVTHVKLSVNGANKNYWRNSVLKDWRGGTHVTVDAIHWPNLLARAPNCKMDIEGMEMPLLESVGALAGPPPWRSLVFEWSFDIDSSITRFRAVVARLRQWYPNVVYGKFDETHPHWPASWFPPCRTVWAWA